LICRPIQNTKRGQSRFPAVFASAVENFGQETLL
jgi:hypothetical protein